MDLATITTLAGLAMTIGGVCYQLGCRSSWADKDRLKGTIDKLKTEIIGLKQQIELAEGTTNSMQIGGRMRRMKPLRLRCR
jgi:hypothetical protein